MIKHVVGSDGERITYTISRGVRQPLVFLPPLFFGHAFWSKVMRHFHGQGHTVIGIDVRGHAPRRMQPFTLETLLSDVQAVLGAERVKKPILIGLSLGGTVAASYAARHHVPAICFNPVLGPTRETVFPQVNALAGVGRLLEFIDFFPKAPGLDLTDGCHNNQLVFNGKIFLKYHASGLVNLYHILSSLKPISRRGIITIVSDADEIVKKTYRPTFWIKGKHLVTLDDPDEVSRVISLALRRLGRIRHRR